MFWPNISGSFDAKSKPGVDNTSSNRQPLGSVSRPKEVAALIEEAAVEEICKLYTPRCIRKGSHGSQSRGLPASGTAERGLMSKGRLITGAPRGCGRPFTNPR